MDVAKVIAFPSKAALQAMSVESGLYLYFVYRSDRTGGTLSVWRRGMYRGFEEFIPFWGSDRLGDWVEGKLDCRNVMSDKNPYTTESVREVVGRLAASKNVADQRVGQSILRRLEERVEFLNEHRVDSGGQLRTHGLRLVTDGDSLPAGGLVVSLAAARARR